VARSNLGERQAIGLLGVFAGDEPQRNRRLEAPGAGLRQILPIFLRDHEDHPRVQIRAEITRDILAERAGAALDFWTDGETWLERLWTLLLLGDYASVYLAFLNQEDPTPVDAIEGLKNRLKESA